MSAALLFLLDDEPIEVAALDLKLAVPPDVVPEALVVRRLSTVTPVEPPLPARVLLAAPVG